MDFYNVMNSFVRQEYPDALMYNGYFIAGNDVGIDALSSVNEYHCLYYTSAIDKTITVNWNVDGFNISQVDNSWFYLADQIDTDEAIKQKNKLVEYFQNEDTITVDFDEIINIIQTQKNITISAINMDDISATPEISGNYSTIRIINYYPPIFDNVNHSFFRINLMNDKVYNICAVTGNIVEV
jgi:hypothetical protein